MCQWPIVRGNDRKINYKLNDPVNYHSKLNALYKNRFWISVFHKYKEPNKYKKCSVGKKKNRNEGKKCYLQSNSAIKDKYKIV